MAEPTASQHVTVLLSEAVEALVAEPDGIYVDATFGRGGHSRAILAQLSAAGRLVAIDRDPGAVESARADAALAADPRFVIEHTAFSALAETLASHGIEQVSGVLLDLGVSSPQIDDPERGFSFRFDGPLDMRMDTSRGESAAEFLARADDPKAATQREWVNLQRAAERVCGYFELLAEDREIGLRFELHAITTESVQVWADQTMLIRAVGNLLSNALRYAPRGTDVVLSATVHAGGGCTFEVSNQGPPITEANQALIFERCFRTDEARVDSASGSGLGLAIVKSVMDLHGGTATVISGTGRHTSFRIWFPGPQAEVD